MTALVNPALKNSSKASCITYTFQFLVTAYALRALPCTEAKAFAIFCLALTSLVTLSKGLLR